MLAVSPKLTTTIDFATPLREYIKSNYGEEAVVRHHQIIQDVHEQRMRLAHAAAQTEGDFSAGIDAALTYYHTLHQIATRFPFAAHSGSSFFRRKITAIKVQFSWTDSFRSNKRGTDFDVNFEKAAVLFDIGALYSLAAINEDRSTESGLVQACKYFNLSAGVFQYLSENAAVFSKGMTVDLSNHSYDMLTKLMLGQAQACIFERSLQTKKGAPHIIACLAMGVSEFFAQAATSAARSPLKGWLSSSKYKWLYHLKYQTACFAAAAHFWQARAREKETEHGIEIAHLEKANALCKTAARFDSGLIAGLSTSRAKLVELIAARYGAAVRENETIYHQPKPDVMPKIASKQPVKPTPFAPNPPSDSDILADLVPVEVQEEAAAFNSQLQEMGQEVTRECQESTDFARMLLSSLNLPAVLEAREKVGDNKTEVPTGVPATLWARIFDVQAKGGSRTLGDMRAEVQARSQIARNALNEVLSMLAVEAAEDESLRAQYGRRWNRIPSGEVTQTFQNDANTVSAYLDSAAESDRAISTELSSFDTATMLDMSQQELAARFPKPPAADSTPTTEPPEIIEAEDSLREMLDQLSAMLEQRDEIAKELSDKAESFDVTPALAAAKGKQTSEQVFVEARREFAPLQEKMSNNLESQQALLDSIAEKHAAFTAAVSAASSGDPNAGLLGEREAIIQGLNVAVDRYNKLYKNLTEGLKFYNDITTSYLTPLSNSVKDFVEARQEEKQILIEEVQAELAVPAEFQNPDGGASAVPSGGAPAQPVQGYVPAPAYNPAAPYNAYAPASAPSPSANPPGGALPGLNVPRQPSGGSDAGNPPQQQSGWRKFFSS